MKIITKLSMAAVALTWFGITGDYLSKSLPESENKIFDARLSQAKHKSLPEGENPLPMPTNAINPAQKAIIKQDDKYKD